MGNIDSGDTLGRVFLKQLYRVLALGFQLGDGGIGCIVRSAKQRVGENGGKVKISACRRGLQYWTGRRSGHVDRSPSRNRIRVFLVELLPEGGSEGVE